MTTRLCRSLMLAMLAWALLHATSASAVEPIAADPILGLGEASGACGGCGTCGTACGTTYASDSNCIVHRANVRPPRTPWYARAEAVMLRRDSDRAVDFASLDVVGNTVLSTRDFDAPFNAGPRILLGRMLNECYFLEGTYFTVAQWDDEAAVRDATLNDQNQLGNLFSPFVDAGTPPVAGLDYNNIISIRQRSYLDGAELNLRRIVAMPPGRAEVSFLFGVRYIGIDEDFAYDATSTVPLDGTTLLRTSTTNDLIGPQIGMLFEFFTEQCWWINFEMKGALCHNSMIQETSFENTLVGGPFPTRATENGTTFVGELNLTAVYRFGPHFSTRFGYQALWVDGLALAAENVNTDVNVLQWGAAQVDNGGSVVYHGPHVGLEFGW